MDTLPITTALQDGVLIVDKVLGHGGFGITYRGIDLASHHYVAIKEFFPSGCVRQGFSVQSSGTLTGSDYQIAKAKFLDEAHVLEQFRYPGIVQVYRCFEENNSAYIVMEYLRGRTLAQVVDERGALGEQEAIGYIKKVADSLKEVHAKRLLHRDIKPENIMICEDERVVLIDFGLTKKVAVEGDLSTRLLTGRTRFGSDGYAPPEQYLKDKIRSPHTDIYALGATLYFSLTGEVPVSAPERAMGATFSPPSAKKPTVSTATDEAVMKAMAIAAELRLQTVNDLQAALRTVSSTPPLSLPYILEQYSDESSRARQLIEHKPKYWQWWLLEELVRTRILRSRQKYDSDIQLAQADVSTFTFEEYRNWAIHTFYQCLSLIMELADIFNSDFNLVWLNQSEDEGILKAKNAADRILSICNELKEIEVQVCKLHPPPHFKRLESLLQAVPATTFQSIEDLFAQLSTLLPNAENGDNYALNLDTQRCLDAISLFFNELENLSL